VEMNKRRMVDETILYPHRRNSAAPDGFEERRDFEAGLVTRPRQPHI